jgi:prepilin-type processing-associated H-X9-DG protein
MIVPLTSEQLRRNRHTNFDTDILLNLATYLAIPQEIIEASAHECMMNQKMLALGAMQFAQDWDDKFTFKADKYPEALRPYLRNDQILHCPDDRSGALSYTFNKNLENLLLARIAQPAQTVMFYEGKNGQLEFRHDNRASVCFADGHVELVTPERAKTLKWTP